MSQAVLIAAPTYSGKEYCFARWLQAINRLNYSDYSVFVVDNSDTLDFYNTWSGRVPMVHLDLKDETPDRRIALSMEYIREQFLASKFSWWLNVETDILIPPTAISTMLHYANGMDMVAAPYLHRTEDRWIDGCFGCTMFSRKIAEVSFADAPKDSHTDMFWREKVDGKYRISEMPRHVLQLEHLNG